MPFWNKQEKSGPLSLTLFSNALKRWLWNVSHLPDNQEFEGLVHSGQLVKDKLWAWQYLLPWMAMEEGWKSNFVLLITSSLYAVTHKAMKLKLLKYTGNPHLEGFNDSGYSQGLLLEVPINPAILKFLPFVTPQHTVRPSSLGRIGEAHRDILHFLKVK